MTGDQKHRNDITNGQHLNRHADQPDVFYFFPTAQNILKFFASRTSGTFGFAPTCLPAGTQANPSQNQKNQILVQAQT